MIKGAYTNLEGIESQRSQRDLSVAKALMYTCYQMYRRTATHISPEYVEFPVNGDMEVPGNVAFYILRPEVAESLFYLSHITKDPIYSEWAYDLWEAIDQYCRVDGGYGALRDVRNVKSGVDDRMESFFYAELVKYLYMAIDPELQTDFLEYVYNTEAHPMSVLGSDHQPVMS
jgi:mannosyl-oligosaccharide alpha-1,2-mannosidase